MKNIPHVFLHLCAGAVCSAVSFPMRLESAEEKFVQRFLKEGLFVVSKRLKGFLLKASECLSCGLCEFTSGYSPPQARFPVSGASFVMHLRSINDVGLLRERVEEMKRFDLARMEASCPVRVPFPALVEEIGQIFGSLPEGD